MEWDDALRRWSDRRGGGLRERGGLRPFLGLLGECEREASVDVKDLARSPPWPLCPLCRSVPRYVGGDLLDEYRRGRGGVTERERDAAGDGERRGEGVRRRRSSRRRPPRPPGMYVSMSLLGGGPRKSFLPFGEPPRLEAGDLEYLCGRLS